MLDWYELWHYLAYNLCGLTKQPIVTAAAAPHSATFEFSLLAHKLQMLLPSKINSHISSNFGQDHQDGRWIIKAFNANWYKILRAISLAPM